MEAKKITLNKDTRLDAWMSSELVSNSDKKARHVKANPLVFRHWKPIYHGDQGKGTSNARVTRTLIMSIHERRSTGASAANRENVTQVEILDTTSLVQLTV